MELLKLFLASSGVSTDTRNIQTGNLFFALKGSNFNGNLFVEKALQMGADYAISGEYNGADHRVIKVENVLFSLQELAKEYTKYLSIPILAITGSNGKTTTKELIAAVLAKKLQLNSTKGNLNNEIGVPLTILSTSQKTAFLIVEMGANHQGEIERLSEIARPNFGIITNIGKAHLEGFGGIEGVKRGKSELYRYLARNQGKIFINQDDDVLMSLLPNNVELLKFNASDFIIAEDFPYLKLNYHSKTINTFLTGNYNVANVAAAFAIGKYFGVNEDDIADAISSYCPKNNRSELIEFNGLKVIKDAYNANPSSVMSSISSFFKSEIKGKVLILGDMLELGEYAEEEHRNILKFSASNQNISQVILIGPIYFSIKESFPQFLFFRNVDEAKANIKLEAFVDKTILLKGSRGIALEKLLE